MLFKDVMVDEELKNKLASLVKNNRISHAQLFLGQPGNHSFALAIAYAQYISCENRQEWDSCGVCPSCVKFEKLSHPDLHLIFPNAISKNVKKDPDSKQFAQDFRKFVLDHNYHIELEDWLQELGGENKQASINIRDCANIINQNSIRSYEGGYKIYILWRVERLYHAAAPKLLKTLEEPENKTLFILLAENTDKILPTILSRTQLVKVPRLTDERIKEQLIADFEASPAIATDIASISEGNYSKAMTLYNERGEMKKWLSDFDKIFSSVLNLALNKPKDTVRFLEVQAIFSELIVEGREAQKNFISYISRVLRNILLSNSQDQALIKATSEEKKIMENFKAHINLKNMSAILNECNQLIYHIERNGNSQVLFTDFYLKLVKCFTK